jgi:perosamine synthetase
LERIDELVGAKRKIFSRYKTLLSSYVELNLNPEPQSRSNSYWMPTVVFSKQSGINQEQLINAFQKANIDARVFFWPLSSLPMFTAKPENQCAYEICQRAINLPSYPQLTESEQQQVVQVISTMFR